MDNENFTNEIKAINVSLKRLTEDFNLLSKRIAIFMDKYNTEVTVNLKSWNQTTENQQKVTWIIVGSVVVALLAVIGLK